MSFIRTNWRGILFISLLSTLFLWIGSTVAGSLLPAADSGVFETGRSAGQWFRLVHFSFNTFGVWRWDPTISAIAALIDTGTVTVVPLLYSLVFAVGLSALLSTTRTHTVVSPLYSVASGFFCAVALLYLFGYDSVLLGALVWMPWLALSLVLFASTVGAFHGVAVLLFSVLAFRASNQFAPLTLGIAVALASTIITAHGLKFWSERWITAVLALTTVVALYTGATTPPPHFPQYPAYARVVPDDGVPGNLLPRVGAAPSIATIDREFMRPAFARASGLILLVIIAGWLSARRSSSSLPKGMLTLAVGFLSCVIVDSSWVPESLSIIGPSQSLQRILPGIFVYSLTPLLLAATLISLTLAFGSGRGCFVIALLVGSSTLTPFSTPLSSWSPSLTPGKFLTPRAQEPYLATRLQGAALSEIVSPSYALIRSYTSDAVANARRNRARKTLPLTEISPSPQISANARPDLLPLLVDKNRETRWSPGGGKQTGREWIYIVLPQAIDLVGLHLRTGPFSSDFPRGVRISTFEHCPPAADIPSRLDGEASILADLPSWQGPIDFTEDGAPYFEGQNRVRVLFKEQTKASCILVKQVGQDERFDWSVAEISLILPADSSEESKGEE